MEAIATRLKAIASRLEAMAIGVPCAIRLEAIASILGRVRGTPRAGQAREARAGARKMLDDMPGYLLCSIAIECLPGLPSYHVFGKLLSSRSLSGDSHGVCCFQC